MKKCGFFIVICEKASYNRDNVHSLTVLSKCFISMIVKGEGGEVDPRYRVDIIWYCDRSVRSVREVSNSGGSKATEGGCLARKRSTKFFNSHEKYLQGKLEIPD